MLADERAFQSLIDTVQGALLLLNPADGTVFAANQLAAILLAVPHNELLYQPFFRYLAQPEDQAGLLARMARQGMVYNEEVTLQSHSGRCFRAQISLREVDFQRPILLISFSDRSETELLGKLLSGERQAFEQLLKLLREYRHTPRPSDPDDYLSGVLDMPALLSGLSHEIGRAGRYRQPLAGMLISVEGILGGQADAESTGYVRRMTGSLCLQSARDCDLVARREDGCLLVVLPHTQIQGATRAARRMIAAFSRQQFNIGGEQKAAAACIGVSALRKDESSHRQLLQRLDQALIRSRAQGVNTLSRQP